MKAHRPLRECNPKKTSVREQEVRQGGREGKTEDARVHAATALQAVFTGAACEGVV